ncbi:hypothetical protein [Occallatibacter savannae]|uniref:hypothetical protein n=1 Tax=Occallatibacter savannae TaxID=1002691 RepID=UPI000D68FCA0|nr:hypothetical protein [Occallatibacter savannae]
MILRTLSPLALAAMLTLPSGLAAAQQGDSLQHVTFDEDVVSLEFIGNVNNSGPNSSQFGYFSFVSQLPAFNGTPETAATANFTFYTEAVNQRVTNNGTLRVVDRVGTTTVYLTTAPASFADPESFRSGTPIQTSTLRQQVILDTTTGEFSVVNINTVTDVAPFYLGGQQYQLGKAGNRFRTLLRGKSNAAAPPGFFMAGYAVGVGKN